MAQNKNLAVADFDTIKSSLKTFLKDNSKFTDYDFEGSGINALLDVLAYNTHHNAFYANMAINEMFLDSAVTRSGVVSRARELGYTPRSATAPTALINVVISNVPVLQQTPTLTVYRGTRFTGYDANNNTYSFVTKETKTAALSNNSYVFDELSVVEGELRSYQFTADTVSNPQSVFELPHDDIDTSTLNVRILETNSSLIEQQATKMSAVYDIASTDLVYFVQENYAGKFEVSFGDGVIGKALTTGNIVNVDYIITNKTLANGINSFGGLDPIAPFSVGDMVITTSVNAYGGAEREENNSIKLNAPQTRAAQRRLVTPNDFKSHLLNNSSLFESINVWGGETNVPPIYGKVFISAKPSNGLYMTNALKNYIIQTYLEDSKIVSIQPEFVDPTYIWLSVTNTVKFASSVTTLSATDIMTLANDLTESVFATHVSSFGKPFVMSTLQRVISNSDQSISSVVTKLRMLQRFWYIPNTLQRIDTSFNNAIVPFSLISQPFVRTANGVTKTCYFSDNPNTTGITSGAGTGVIQLKEFLTNTVLSSSLGTVDYATGAIVIPGINIVSLYNDTGIDLKFSCQPQESDISAVRNQIVVLDDIAPGTFQDFVTGLSTSIVDTIV